MIQYYLTKSQKLIFAIFIIPFFFFFPLVASYLIVALSFMFKKSGTRNILYLFACISFGLVSYTKQPFSDLAIYFDKFFDLNQLSFVGFFLKYKIEQGFYGISWVLSKLAGDNVRFILLFWVVYSYFFVLYGIDKLSRIYKAPNLISPLLCLYILYFGYDLSMVNHLLRQYASFGVLFLSLVLFICNKEKKSLYVYILSILLHTSAMLYFPLFLILKFVKGALYSYLLMMSILISAFLIGMNDLVTYVGYLPTFNIDYLINIKNKFSGYDYNAGFSYSFFDGFEYWIWIALALVYLHIQYFLNRVRSVDVYVFIILMFYLSCLVAFRNTDILFYRQIFFMPIIFIYAVVFVSSKGRLLGSIGILGMVLYAASSILRFYRAISAEGDTIYIFNDLNLFLTNVITFLMW